MSRRIWPFVLLFVFLSSGCLGGDDTVVLATTTSTYDSGLLDYLLPAFEDEYNIEVVVVPVGTGRALEYGRRGDVDVILVHSPEDEIEFVEEGYGTLRHCVMYNEFLIVGPPGDPAGIKGGAAINSLRRILNRELTFISRGDDSGTHKKELALWEIAGGYQNRGSWYIETGTGMGKTLLVADEMEGYTLVDRGTYMSMKDSVNLEIMVSGDELLKNPYGMIAVSLEENPGVNYRGAQKLIEWFMSGDGQRMIGEFTKDGEQLFVPLHGECME